MSEYRLGIEQIREFLPHRSPFLFVDRILEIHPAGDLNNTDADDKVGTKVVGLKNYTYNEPFMQGHFPEFSVVPGVLLVEMMAQVACFSVYPFLKQGQKFQVFLAGVDQTRFRKPVVPGDTVRVETLVTRKRGKIWMFDATAFVDGQKVAETQLLANLILPAQEKGASS
jgi:3-hydroxyacyl-[acyl-carrier-protein] dehydratase